MATQTTFVWDETKQCMVPQTVQISIADLNKAEPDSPMSDNAVGPLEQLVAEGAGTVEPKATRKRGRVAAYDPGTDAAMIGGKIPQAWIDELCAKASTENKAFALYTAIKAYLNK